MTNSNNLKFALIQQSQAQKEITVNEALTTIDALMNIGAKSITVATPPGSPNPGDLYIVAASPTGAWTGQANNIAWYNQVWQFIVPNAGMSLFVADQGKIYAYNGTSWFVTNSALSVLGDVSISSPVSNSFLVYNSSTGKWTNESPSSSISSLGLGTLATLSSVGTSNITASAVTYAKIQNESASTLLGNPTGSGAAPSEITLGSGLSFSGSVLNVSAGSGTVTSVATGSGLTGGTITSSGTIAVASNGISNSLIRQSTASSLVGNPTGSTANVQDITLGAGLSFSGTALNTVNNGTVTSVAISMPAEFSVSGSPITGSGTLAVTKANENANTVYAGPGSGSAAAPTFRTLTVADLPFIVSDIVSYSMFGGV